MSTPTQTHMEVGNLWSQEWLLDEDNSVLQGIAPIAGGALEDTRATFIFTPDNGRDKSVNAPRIKTVDYKRINLAYLEDESFTTPTNTGSIVTQLAALGMDIVPADIVAANVVANALVLTATPTSLLYVGTVTLSQANLNW